MPSPEPGNVAREQPAGQRFRAGHAQPPRQAPVLARGVARKAERLVLHALGRKRRAHAGCYGKHQAGIARRLIPGPNT